MSNNVPGHVNGEIPTQSSVDDEYTNQSDFNDFDEDSFSIQETPMASCPPFRPQRIHNIVETVDRYNPQNIEILESYVEEQLSSSHYDRDSCLAILKLYQFNPSSTNFKVIASILTLSLGALPDPDFNLCLCLLNEEIIQDPTIQTLMQLWRFLESCQFEKFWRKIEEIEDNKVVESEEIGVSTHEILAECRAFKEMVRCFIAQIVSVTYQTIKLDLLAEFVDLAGDKLADWIDDKGWVFDDNNPLLVNMPVTKDNMPKPVIVQETIKFEQLTKIIGYGRLTV